MKVPVFFDVEFVDIKTGRLTVFGRNLINQLLDQMQKSVSDEGFVIPSLSTSDIAKLDKSANYTLVGDSTENTLKVKLNNSFKTIATL